MHVHFFCKPGEIGTHCDKLPKDIAFTLVPFNCIELVSRVSGIYSVTQMSQEQVAQSHASHTTTHEMNVEHSIQEGDSMQ